MDIQQRVLKVIAEVLNRSEGEIRPDATIRGELNVSSLDQMTIFVALEDEFQRSIPQEEVAGLATVNDIINFIAKKTQDAPAACAGEL